VCKFQLPDQQLIVLRHCKLVDKLVGRNYIHQAVSETSELESDIENKFNISVFISNKLKRFDLCLKLFFHLQEQLVLGRTLMPTSLHAPTLWRRVFLDKSFIVAWLDKIFSDVRYRVHKSLALRHVLSQTNPIHIPTTCFFKIYFILSFHLYRYL
jgi:hypothetical protein